MRDGRLQFDSVSLFLELHCLSGDGRVNCVACCIIEHILLFSGIEIRDCHFSSCRGVFRSNQLNTGLRFYPYRSGIHLFQPNMLCPQIQLLHTGISRYTRQHKQTCTEPTAQRSFYTRCQPSLNILFLCLHRCYLLLNSSDTFIISISLI